jgi:GWxTD domain-containing protein
MITIKAIAVPLCILLLAVSSDASAPKKTDPWKQWLKEVEPIMTRQERSVAKLLQTVEERKRFQELFWKARNPNPHNPRNEYKLEYYRRRDYAGRKLGGVHSDRGRIYILLGKPFRVENFSGQEKMVECEMWEYRTGGRNGLFPFMNIVFFKPRNMGDYQLYHPGIHRPGDLLSPYYEHSIRSQSQAYRELKVSSAELALASLSIIPGEGDPEMNISLSSSNFALNKVYTLPEREAEAGYIRNFKSPTGTVQVTHTTNAIRGYGCAAVSRNKGVTFLHYALMPDVLKMKHASIDVYSADINLHINIEDENGTFIYQNLRKIDLKVDPAKKQDIDKRKIIFMNFEPIIEGNFNVTIMFINKTTREFFTYKKKISVNRKGLSAVVGFKLKPIDTGNYMPFAADNFLVLTDPRSTFNQKEALEGIVQVSTPEPEPPDIYLESLENKNHRVKIESLEKVGDLYKFRQPLSGIKDDNYRLFIKALDSQIVSRKIHVLPFYIDIKKPLTITKPEPESSLHNYRFLQAQQYLNAGKVDRSIEYFDKIPRRFWNAHSLPIIARAYYAKKDYARVIQLLEKEEVKKGYATLILLANASIELKMYNRAIEYLEKLRKYGDSIEVNQLLAAAYLSIGQQEKAKQYYEKARELMKQ